MAFCSVPVSGKKLSGKPTLTVLDDAEKAHDESHAFIAMGFIGWDGGMGKGVWRKTAPMITTQTVHV